ncbi:hypothetical protein JCM24511_01967 [Saitozyma sp. JCM 24511]|nr:hypothetical protein JCM24511_01967 [Saitozyma sp. JCM 24511]
MAPDWAITSQVEDSAANVSSSTEAPLGPLLYPTLPDTTVDISTITGVVDPVDPGRHEATGEAVRSTPPSLDLEGGDDQESHFLGSAAFLGLALPERDVALNPSESAILSFRQVSSNPRLPAYFVRQPSLLYGRPPNTGRSAYDTVCADCAGIEGDITSRSLDALRRFTLPALPFINGDRLERACLGLQGSEPVPYGLLAVIIAHATPYLPEIRPLHKKLWSSALLGLEDEYRIPRLRTLQLALLALSARPSENIGQSDIGLARAIGTAHLLGLHMDPSGWRLPAYERSLRKRMWWNLMIHDKWRALLFGRPSNIHSNNCNVPLPTLEDCELGDRSSPADQLSFETFEATCKLTVIIDRILLGFYTVEALTKPLGPLQLIGLLESVQGEMRNLEGGLSPTLRLNMPNQSLLSTLPTGIRSWQLSFSGVKILLSRLLLDVVTGCSPIQLFTVLEAALNVCRELVEMVTHITPGDRAMFWMPYSSHHISNCVSLLLRIAIRGRPEFGDLVAAAVGSTITLTQNLIRAYEDQHWDVAGAGLKRIASLLLMADQDLPETKGLYQSVIRALGIVQSGTSMSADDLLASIGLDDFDPFAWINNDWSWLVTGDEQGGQDAPQDSTRQA